MECCIGLPCATPRAAVQDVELSIKPKKSIKPKARDLFGATALLWVQQTTHAILKAAFPGRAGGQGGLFMTFLLAALIIKDSFFWDNFLTGKGQRFTNFKSVFDKFAGGVETGVLKT